MAHQRENDRTTQSPDQLRKELAESRKRLSEYEARVEELRQANRELDALTRVTDNAIRTLDIRELADLLLGRLVEVINADAGTILIVRDRELRITASIGMGDQETSDRAAQPGQDFTQIVMSTDKPLYIEDVQIDPRITDPFIRGQGIRTMLGVPLKFRENIVGALLLLWFGVHGENPRDIRLLEVTADRCAAAINNALLFEQVRQSRDELERKVRERTVELSDVVRDLNLEADIRKRTERDLRRARREIEFYFDLMGHDIGERDRSALRLLREAVDKVRADGEIGRDDERLLLTAMREIEGSMEITHNISLLRAALAVRQTPKVIDLNAVLRETVGRFAGVHDRAVTIGYYLSPLCKKMGCKVIATDLHREVYANIISNAIDRSAGPLAINISLANISEGGERYCRVTIEDDSPGIPDDLKRHVFETGELDIGVKRIEGLGLFVVRTLVESSGGIVRVEDRVPGDYAKGSRFIILMPAKYDAPSWAI